MKVSSIAAIGIGLCAVVGAGVACGPRAQGRVVIGVKDGPPTSSDGRTISALEIDITRIELEAKGQGEQQGPDGGSATDNKNEQEEDVTVFDSATGGARTIDLLKVTSFSALVANTTVPAGTYQNARVSISAARVVFADAPSTRVPLILEGESKKSKASFEFKFKPAVVVGATGTAVAVIDFVPAVQKDATGYHLGHDGEHDDSGDKHEGAELELHGKVVSFDAVKKLLTLEGGVAIDASTATFTLRGHAALVSDIAVGQRAEVEGMLNATTGTLMAKTVDLE